MPEATRVAVFGGIYSNHLALAAALDDAHRRGVEACYCLGDLGAFGPHPDRVFPLLHEHASSVSRATTTTPSATTWRIASAATRTRATITSPA